MWLDNITRPLLDGGVLARYVDSKLTSGLTSNPSIFDAAIAGSGAYDADIFEKACLGTDVERAFFELALHDLKRAADLFRPVFDVASGIDGWVSMEIPPLLANDTAGSLLAAASLHAEADRPNLFVKIPGTPAGRMAIEEATAAGIPVNVTLLFSVEQYLAAAAAYLRGIERRIVLGCDPAVCSVASIFVSRWDGAVNARLPADLRNQLGIAVARSIYRSHRELMESTRWRRAIAAGAKAQVLLWASTGQNDPALSPTLYFDALASADTIITVPESVLASAGARAVSRVPMRVDGDDSDVVLERVRSRGVEIVSIAITLQLDGTRAFVEAWRRVLQRLVDKGARAGRPAGDGLATTVGSPES